MNDQRVQEILEEAQKKFPDALSLRFKSPSESCTTFAVGAPLEVLIDLHSLEALEWLLPALSSIEVSPRFLGAGSNLILPDEILRSPVIRFGRGLSGALPLEAATTGYAEHKELSQAPAPAFGESEVVFAFAGASLMSLSRRVSQAGLSGLEFAAGIPASIGGAVRMNAGAHGHSLSEVLTRVFYLSPEGIPGELSGETLRFEYRHCELPEAALVYAAEFRLTAGDPEEIVSVRQDCLDYRKKTQPLQFPSAGSVFRNPVRSDTVGIDTAGIDSAEVGAAEVGTAGSDAVLPAAGALLEQAGMKGQRMGAILYSELHANWLIRDGEGGRSEDVRGLVELGRASVREKFGIELETEIIFW